MSPPMLYAKSPLSTVTTVSRMPSSTVSTKRPFINDENALFNRSPPKRVKSALSENPILASPTTTTTTTAPAKPDKLPKRRAFGVLSNITNTHNRIDKKSSATTTARPSKKSLNASSPPTPTSRRKSQSPIVESRRAHKRARSPVQRVGRATATTSQLSESVATAVLEHDTPSPHNNNNNNNSAEASPTTTTTATMLQPMPSSWTFEIYEDTPEETLQNLMEFSTHTLNISSSSSSSSSPDESESELSQKGKENIPPARLLEIFSAPIELAMSVDTPEKLIPQQQEGATRPALRELTPEEVGGPIAPAGEDVVLEEDEDQSTPAKECSPSGRYEFGSGDKSPKWAVWESPTPVTTTTSPIVDEEEAENEENTPPPKVLSLTKAYNLLEKKKKLNKVVMNKKTTPTTSGRGRQQQQQQQKGMFEKENYSGSKSKLSGGIRGIGGMFGARGGMGMGMGMGKRRGVEVFVDAV